MHAGDLYCAARCNVTGEYSGVGQGDCIAQVQEGVDGLPLESDLDAGEAGVWVEWTTQPVS